MWVVAKTDRPHALEPIEHEERWARISEQRAVEPQPDKKPSLLQQSGHNGSVEKPIIHIRLGGRGSQQMVPPESEDSEGDSSSEQNLSGIHVVHVVPHQQSNSRIHVVHITANGRNGSGMHVIHIIHGGGDPHSNESSDGESRSSTSTGRERMRYDESSEGESRSSESSKGDHSSSEGYEGDRSSSDTSEGDHSGRPRSSTDLVAQSSEESSGESSGGNGSSSESSEGDHSSSRSSGGESKSDEGSELPRFAFGLRRPPMERANLTKILNGETDLTNILNGRSNLNRETNSDWRDESDESSGGESESDADSEFGLPSGFQPDMKQHFLQHLMQAMQTPHLYPDVNVYTPSSQAQCNLLDHQRRDCAREGETPQSCTAKGCCWEEGAEDHVPECFYGPEDLLLQELLQQSLSGESQMSHIMFGQPQWGGSGSSNNMFGLMDALGGMHGMNSSMPGRGGHSGLPHLSLTVHVKNKAADEGNAGAGEIGQGWHMGVFESGFLKGESHLASPWVPSGAKPKSCSFIGDCGSTGNRLQMYTADDMCPDEQYVSLNCGNGEHYPHLYLFAEPSGVRPHSVLLTMRQIVSLQAGIGLEEDETWINQYPHLKKPGYLTDCVAHTLLRTLMNKREVCSSASLELDATAGVRNYEATLEQEGKHEEVARYQKAIVDINKRLMEVFAPYKSNGITFNRFTVLRIQDEAELEATAVRLWSSSIMVAAGQKLSSTLSGIFSMGGKSSQFLRFKSHSNVKDGEFLLGYGHKQGLADYESGGTDMPDDDRRKLVEAGVRKAFATAKEQGQMNTDEDFGTGLWIGVTNTVLAAESKYGLQLKPETMYTFQDVKSHMDKALTAIDPGVKDQKKILIKLLIINYWLGQVFRDTATFYFRHQWPLPKGEGCVYSEWPSAQAVLDDRELQQDLGIKPGNVSFARVEDSEASTEAA